MIRGNRITRTLMTAMAALLIFALMMGPLSVVQFASSANGELATPLPEFPADGTPSGLEETAYAPAFSRPDANVGFHASDTQAVNLAQDPGEPFMTANGVLVNDTRSQLKGCLLTIEFWNFPILRDFATILIEIPGNSTGGQWILDTTIPVGDDEAQGTGDLDASRSFDLKPFLEKGGWTSEVVPTVALIVTAPTAKDAIVRSGKFEIHECLTPPGDEPTATPKDEPTATPTDEPAGTPTDDPTATPTDEPTVAPTATPTATEPIELTPTFVATETSGAPVPVATTAPEPTAAAFPAAVLVDRRNAPIVPALDPATSDGYRAGQLSVILNEGVDPYVVGDRYQLDVLDWIDLLNLVLFGAPPGTDLDALRALMANDPDIGVVEANSIYKSPEGHDRSQIQFSQPSNLVVDDPDYGYETVGAAEPGCVTGDGVTVAVLDTGIDTEHELFAGRLLPGWSAVTGTDNVDEVQNGVDEDDDGETDEMYGHGTHVAGIVARVAPGVMIMPVQVLNDDGIGDAFGLAQGIVYATANGADVINLSLSSVTDSEIVRRAIESAREQGVVVVAATGNSDHDEPKEYPAAIDGVIAVAALGPDDVKSSFSNYGGEIRMSAPGTNIESALPGGEYGVASGTSMAAPFIAAAAALTIERYPEQTPDEIARTIYDASQTIDPVNPDYVGQLGAGRLDLVNALSCE